jgi:transposase-like protein
MRQTTGTRKSPGEKIVKDIKRATRKQYSSEEKIRIVLDGLRGEDSIAELCRREGARRMNYFVAVRCARTNVRFSEPFNKRWFLGGMQAAPKTKPN